MVVGLSIEKGKEGRWNGTEKIKKTMVILEISERNPRFPKNSDLLESLRTLGVLSSAKAINPSSSFAQRISISKAILG